MPCYSSYRPMKLISNLSTHVLAVVIKSQRKNKNGKMMFFEFQSHWSNFAECINPDFLCKGGLPAYAKFTKGSVLPRY